ncbi:glycosidase [Parabacteroides sp. PF5-5]|uniref:alpha-amylase family glycosyl hydrolase n=1 Tax=unclassified Parabacteroides TaxID=2649774 RepID=UPI002476462C|nr:MULTISPECIES: alpha-amylase family glycosyl hydrolase [unclassified Parabacteroides]MDH6305691.1 glycosidase [Parabacteroides sp. PH5-39]MDH6316763.1 glycosidase [Parabacteroides sp. PF5-13]MDH6320404.1 glycosidase [Parabacteroides sp. PH5-13]MDH6324134.1 glycosidase [Parabacteroides sp. PH5-8]MDH6327949.1 glycosidase [Parabacteroides sp. PH5-41]
MDKMIIYQTFPRLFGNTNEVLVRNGNKEENGVGKFSAYTPQVLEKIKELGITHIWYTGVIEHATQTDYSSYGIRTDHSVIVKGKAGSPYAIKDYYDIDPDLADDVPFRMAEFESLVERTHQAGMKVIIDFVPNHVARQYHSDVKPPFVEDLGQHDNTNHAFDVNNNFYYIPGQTLDIYFGAQHEDFVYAEFPAKATGNNRFDAHPNADDWYETVKLNYGVDFRNGGSTHFDPIPNTWKKMLDILKFWAAKGIDGFRCDMAEMVPVEFWNWAIPEVKKEYKVLFIAEIYNPSAYRNFLSRGQFDYLYDKVGLYDTLRAVIQKQAPASNITRTWQAVEGIQDHMLNFLENHDEQRIASDFFAGNPFAGYPGMIVAATISTCPVMIYNGQELGEAGMDDEGFSGRDGRTTIFDYWSMTNVRNWVNHHSTFKQYQPTEEQKRLRKQYARLLCMAQKEAVFTQGQFYDLMYVNMDNSRFNPDRQFAYMRKYKNEVALIVVNFDDTEQNVCVNIPQAAFDYLEIEDNKAAKVINLLIGEEAISTLTTAVPYQINLPPYGGQILKFSY